MKANSKVLWVAGVGSALELYNFTLYAVMIPLLATKFFPQDDPQFALLASQVIFASGFFIRPLTAILWGYLGDRQGRRVALSYTMIAMALPTLAIGFLPTYAEVGLLAPLTLLLCRMLQGASMSGEFNGAMIFVLEHNSVQKRGTLSGLLNAINTVGVVVATALGLWVSTSDMPDWAWRVPFIFGACVGGVAFFVRRVVTESPIYKEIQQGHRIVSNPLKGAFAHKEAAFLTFMQAAFNGAITYTVISFIGTFMDRYLGFPKFQILIYSTAVMAGSVILDVFCGQLVDRFGLNRIMRISAGLIILGIVPAFLLLQGSNPGEIWTALFFFSLFISVFAVCTHAFIQGLFPPEVRFSGIAFFYNLGMSLVGGTTPLVLTTLLEKTGNIEASASYVGLVGIVYIACLMGFYRKNTREKAPS